MREDLEAIRVMGFWYWAWCRTGMYGRFMRLAHRFNWCYMKPMPIIERDRQQHWCQWCGLRDSKYIGKSGITRATSRQ